jgi:FtsP/CotA-like multicopper oxidase with cupredoxin domain
VSVPPPRYATARHQLKFTDFTGTFMYHRHILEHEDMGMMGNYQVVADDRNERVKE